MTRERSILLAAALLPLACGAAGRQTQDPGSASDDAADTSAMNPGQLFAFHVAAVVKIIKENRSTEHGQIFHEGNIRTPLPASTTHDS